METEIREVDSLIDVLDQLDELGIQGAQRKQVYESYLGYCARGGHVPLSGSFELTPLCNFNCPMCYVHLNEAQMGGQKLLTGAQWKSIIAQAVEYGMMYADLTGGECLTHPDFRDIYRTLASCGVQTSVLTNGSLITEDMADFFVQYPPAIVQITLYAADAEGYRQVTGRDAFDTVIAAIQRLKRRGIPMRLTVTPNRELAGSEEKLLRFIKELDIPYGIGGVMLPARPETGRQLETYAPETDVFVRLFQAEKEVFGSQVQGNPPKRIMWIPKKHHQTGQLGCGAGSMSFHVNWRGEMTPCIPFHTVRRSVQEYGFADAWAWIGEQVQKYRVPDECRDCKLRDRCVTCAAEKSMGKLCGTLNRAVCKRLQRYVDEKIMATDFSDCV